MAASAPGRFSIGRPARIAAAAGALWGVLGYAVLWGHTPLFPSRTFVVGPLGTILFAPVRAVLWGIHQVEARSSSAPFDFSQNNGWIGGLAGLTGAGMAAVMFLGIRALARAEARRRRPAGRRPAGR